MGSSSDMILHRSGGIEPFRKIRAARLLTLCWSFLVLLVSAPHGWPSYLLQLGSWLQTKAIFWYAFWYILTLFHSCWVLLCSCGICALHLWPRCPASKSFRDHVASSLSLLPGSSQNLHGSAVNTWKVHKGTQYWTWGPGMTISGYRWNLECKPCCKDVKVQLDRFIFTKLCPIWLTPTTSQMRQFGPLPGQVVCTRRGSASRIRGDHPSWGPYSAPGRPLDDRQGQLLHRRFGDRLETDLRTCNKRMFHWTRGPWELRGHHRHCWLFSPHQDQGLNLWFAGANEAFKT